jgi:molecular chaperone HscB
MNLDGDDFELFALDRRFALDAALLDERRRALQARTHPDKFSAQGAAAQRIALQWSVRVNEAHERLKDPLRRAAYLCELRGQRIDAQTNTAMPAVFLTQQIELREALDDARRADEVQSLSAQLAAQRHSALQRLEFLLDEQGDTASAAQEVRALMFVERFAADIDARLEALGE